MRTLGFEPIGGEGKTVEVDETFLGFQDGANWKTPRAGSQFRNCVLTLVERGGSARSFHVEGTTVGQLIPIIRANIQRESIIMTDGGSWYRPLGAHFLSHDTVNHSIKEYVRRRHFDQHSRGLLFDLQARDAWRVSALCGKALAPLPCGV